MSQKWVVPFVVEPSCTLGPWHVFFSPFIPCPEYGTSVFQAESSSC